MSASIILALMSLARESRKDELSLIQEKERISQIA